MTETEWSRDLFREIADYLGISLEDEQPTPQEAQTAAEPQTWAPNGYDDAEVVDIIKSFDTWSEYERLLNGEAYDDGGADLSTLDFKLCCHIAFVCGPNADQVERILLDPEIVAPRADGKWSTRRGGKTYLQYTIDKAIKHLKKGDGFYVGPGNDPGDFHTGTEAVVDEPAPSTSTPPPPVTSDLLTRAERARLVTDTWLDDYLAYCALRTDAPAIFHEAIGLVVLSAAVGQRGTIELGQGDHSPMLWVLLVAPSTIYRKTTSLNLGRALLRDLEQRRDTKLLAPSEFTPQRFVAILAERGAQPIVLVRDEFSGFYKGLNRLEYMAGGKELLCLIYDGQPFEREKMKPRGKKSDEDDDDESAEPTWRFHVEQPFLAIAAGTTPNYLIETADPDDIKAGFLPRFACVVPPPIQRGTKRRRISMLTQSMTDARASLGAELERISTTVKGLRLSDEALERFNVYTEALEDLALDAVDSELVGAIAERSSWMAFHAAQLLAAGSRTPALAHDGIRLVDMPHILRGIDIAERWRGMTQVLLGQLVPSKFERMAGKIVSLVERHPLGVTRRDVMRSLHINRKEMNDYEATLKERGEIRVEKQSLAGGEQAMYYPPSG